MKRDQASSTAFTVAQGVLLCASRPGGAARVPEANAAAYRRILTASVEGRRRLKQLESPLFRALAPRLERLMIPGLSLHYVLRKRFIEEAARQALADGYTQVVSLGAGFDTLAWRLHRDHAQATFIEIDHPATSVLKQPAVDQRGPNLHLLAVDLAEHDLVTVLGGYPAFDGARRTFFICEGVLPYLPAAAVAALFGALKRLSGAGTRFVFTAVAPAQSDYPNTGWLLRLYLKLLGEPLAWSLEPGDLPAFVVRQGYRLLEQVDDEALAPRYFSGLPSGVLHRGEFLGLTEAV